MDNQLEKKIDELKASIDLLSLIEFANSVQSETTYVKYLEH